MAGWGAEEREPKVGAHEFMAVYLHLRILKLLLTRGLLARPGGVLSRLHDPAAITV